MTNRAEDVAFNYIEEAHVTMSPQFHAGKISKNDLKVLVHNAIDAIAALDAVKKAIFYGRELPAGFAEANALNGPCAPLILPELAPADSPNRYQASINIFHGILGVVTESGEMLEALAESLFETGAPLDGVNMREEVGDAFWYEAAIAKAFGFTFDNAQRVNIQKLRARFPDKFSEYDANNRNLFTERRILEGEPEAVPYVSMTTLEARIKALRGIKQTQCSPGNYDVSEYMRGLANGLILAEAVIDGKEPTYLEVTPRELAEALKKSVDADTAKA